jgi:RNA polymerase sigma factor for flagellar operon FliA
VSSDRPARLPSAGEEGIADPPTEVDAFGAVALHEEDVGSPPEKTRAEIEALVGEALPAVPGVANRLARQIGILSEIEELEAAGKAALVEIAQSFDPRKGPFVPFARARLRWAMLDSVRRETHGRMFSARAYALAAAERVGRASIDGPPDAALPESSHALHLRRVLAAQAAAMVTALAAPFADEPTSTGEHAAVPRAARAPREPSPEDILALARQARALRDAVASLEPRARAIIERHYFGGERFDHIAESLGVSKSWLSRLHAQALEALAEVMKDHA